MTRIVDDDVDAAETLHRGLDDRLAAGASADRVITRSRLAAGCADLVYDRVRH